MQELATVLDKEDDARRFGALLDKGIAAYHTKFFNNTAVGYGQGSQCSNMMALVANVTPNATASQATSAALLHDIVTTHSKHLNVGIVGTTFIFDLLGTLGQHSLALDLLLDDSFPSFGYMLANNATTWWESWQGTVHEQVRK